MERRENQRGRSNSPFPQKLPIWIRIRNADFTPREKQTSIVIIKPNLTAATTRPGLHPLALTDLDGRLVVHRRRAHALLDLPSHGQECLLNIRCALSGGFEEWDAKAIRKFLFQRNSVSTYDNDTNLKSFCPFGTRNKPLQQCTRLPSYLPYHSCCQPGAC